MTGFFNHSYMCPHVPLIVSSNKTCTTTFASNNRHTFTAAHRNPMKSVFKVYNSKCFNKQNHDGQSLKK